MKRLPLLLSLVLAIPASLLAADRPNVVMICVDDMNAYAAKKQYPLIQTPAIDRLKAQSTFFPNAACNSPVCNPSRSSFFSGLYPHTTGAYLNGSDGWNRSEILKQIKNLPEHFQANGYVTWGAGKMLHNQISDEREYAMWSNAPTYQGGFGPFGDEEHQYGSRFRSIQGWTGPDTDFPDVKNANGAIDFLQEEHEMPFFLFYGLWRPHSPYTAPGRFFDQYDESDFDFPPGRLEGDLDDVPELGRLLTDGLHKYEGFDIPREALIKRFLWAYAANTSFADWNVGRVLEALDNSPYADNTIVVFFSDNGFHNSEKERWGKATLWDLSACISMMVRVPGQQARTSPATVSLVDLYPTLVDYCGIPAPDHKLDGHSFVPVLEDPTASWAYPAFTSYGVEYASVRDTAYRYIRYPDGSEELYEYASDPWEFTNRSDDPGLEPVKERLRQYIPAEWAPSTGGRLEVPRDMEKVMRPPTPWDHLKPNS